MATTSSGIRYPVSGDSVNIATDIQNTATDIDTKIAAQTFGLTTAGDLATHNGTEESRLASFVANKFFGNHILTANSSAANGIEWSTSHLPNMYLIASGSSLASLPVVTFSNIPQSFSAIRVYAYIAGGSTARVLHLNQINGILEGNTTWTAYGAILSSGINNASFTLTRAAGDTSPVDGHPFGYQAPDNNRVGWAEITIYDYADTSNSMKALSTKYILSASTTGRNGMGISVGHISILDSSASQNISSITFTFDSTNTTQRRNDFYLYGIK